jgi:hypothetical protein
MRLRTRLAVVVRTCQATPAGLPLLAGIFCSKTCSTCGVVISATSSAPMRGNAYCRSVAKNASRCFAFVHFASCWSKYAWALANVNVSGAAAAFARSARRTAKGSILSASFCRSSFALVRASGSAKVRARCRGPSSACGG